METRPRVTRGASFDADCSGRFQNFAADLANLQPPPNLTGKSFRPLLSDPAQPFKQAAFTVVTRPGGIGRTVRTARYRYTLWPDGSHELYDHDKDPDEYHNIATDPASAPIAAEHAALIDAMRTD